MPRPRRMYLSKNVYFATSRVRQGLPLVPDRLINSIIKGIIARALSLYPVEICDVIFLGNHFHIVFICYDSQLVADFFCYLKGELASAVNKLTGKRGALWSGRTDTPRLATVDSIIEKIIYLYTNPQESGLVDRIEQYPGVSSWESLAEGKKVENCPWYMTGELQRVLKSAEEIRFRNRLIESLEAEYAGPQRERPRHDLKLNPLGWVKHFAGEITEDEARERIIKGVRERESELRATRSFAVIGKRRLKRQSIYKFHKPEKFGRRVHIICSDLGLRKRLVKEYYAFVEHCYQIYQAWKRGDFSEFFPPGAFAPPACRIASAI